MLNLIRAEWLKLANRPLTRILLAIFFVWQVLQIIVQFVFLKLVGQNIGANDLLIRGLLEEWNRQSTFPGIFGAVFGHVNGLGGILAIIFTAAAMGSEYGWGTVRTHLMKYPDRIRYLLAKVATLLLMFIVTIVLTLALATLSRLILSVFGGGIGTISPASLSLLPLAAVRSIYILLPYVLLTLAITIVSRSALIGLAGGILYLVFEILLGTFVAVFQMLGPVGLLAYNLTVQRNINTLVLLNNQSFGLRAEELAPEQVAVLANPSVLQAMIVIALYCALFLAAALHFFCRRDVTGAS